MLRVGVRLQHEQHLPDGTPGVGLRDLLYGGEVQGELVEGFRVDEGLGVFAGLNLAAFGAQSPELASRYRS
ncbi:hypothetical protein GCM10010434_009860 [Winogradskya humida]